MELSFKQWINEIAAADPAQLNAKVKDAVVQSMRDPNTKPTDAVKGVLDAELQAAGNTDADPNANTASSVKKTVAVAQAADQLAKGNPLMKRMKKKMKK